MYAAIILNINHFYKTCSIAPNYSGTVYGLRNFAAQITGEFQSKIKINSIFWGGSNPFFTGFMMPAVISAFTKCEVTIIFIPSMLTSEQQYEYSYQRYLILQ